MGQRAGLGGAAGRPGWPENLAFSVLNWARWPGTSPSEKIASAGQAGSQAPQPAHSPGWIQGIGSPSQASRPGIGRSGPRRSCPAAANRQV
jgi:hypothetical protein